AARHPRRGRSAAGTGLDRADRRAASERTRRARELRARDGRHRPRRGALPRGGTRGAWSLRDGTAPARRPPAVVAAARAEGRVVGTSLALLYPVGSGRRDATLLGETRRSCERRAARRGSVGRG